MLGPETNEGENQISSEGLQQDEGIEENDQGVEASLESTDDPQRLIEEATRDLSVEQKRSVLNAISGVVRSVVRELIQSAKGIADVYSAGSERMISAPRVHPLTPRQREKIQRKLERSRRKYKGPKGKEVYPEA